MADTPRQQCITRYEALKIVRQSWLSHWEEISLYELPRRGRYLVSDTNKGGKKNDKVINGEAILAGRILASGMVAGVISPARKWFRLGTPNLALADSGAVRGWLADSEDRMFEVIARSNFYDQGAQVFSDLGYFGTAAMWTEEDLDDVIRCQTFPIGSYCLANDSRMRVNTLTREFVFTAAQVTERWPDSCSDRVRELVRKGQTEEPIRILLLVEPRRVRNTRNPNALNMPFRGLWLELDHPKDSSVGYLEETGFHEFPAMCPRWDLSSEDVYGRSPGMDALGDVKQLQLYEREGAKAMAKVVAPPMMADTSFKLAGVDLFPGSVNYGETRNSAVLKPAHDPPYQAVQAAAEKVRELQRTINRFFFADLFQMLMQDDRRQITAEEIRARQQEKMLQLGPVMERINDEYLDPFVDRLFGIMQRATLLAPPPEELQGQPLRVEYISVMAQAQKMLGTSSDERLVGFVMQVSQLKPDGSVVDNVNLDRLVQDYAEKIGVNPETVNSEDVRNALRDARAKQAQAAAMGQAMAQAAASAKDLANAPMDTENALTRVVGPIGAAEAGQ